ncbi:hypothetical protein Agabi119p4_6432 [Agaricus bisporus var. burnettii]|uniref:Uncharacterized protein n=1 Tax=Agaricus bisporus var. burnettii TaxID=192524 RepID=A0A8H7CA14_AGABI|nr:hypothetical protein Agabi119p4_6432 [Agaricus bisporus var. burnettii]
MMGSFEKRHIKVSSPSRIEALASSHPFTRQVDIVFPAGCCIELENALSRLSTQYVKGRVDLEKVFAAGPAFVRQYKSAALQGGSESAILALSLGQEQNNQSRDVWCIDTRGVLTSCIDKETYEKLALVGQKMTFKHQNDERYVISWPLHQNAETGPMRSRIRRVLESWDTGFVDVGGPNVRQGPNTKTSSKGAWNVIYCSTDIDINNDALERWTSQVPVADPTTYKVDCEKKFLENVWIPNPSSIPPRPNQNQKDELEDWEHDTSALHEWVGMAGLHAERLFANDRVDPYVALYDPPTTSRVGNIVHLRWTGFLPPEFVQLMIDTTSTYLQERMKPSSHSSSDDMFVAMTVHGITNSPVVYLPSQSSGVKAKKIEPPLLVDPSKAPAHLPRKDGEDTWCLIVMPPKEKRGGVKCILVESVGQWDARWG